MSLRRYDDLDEVVDEANRNAEKIDSKPFISRRAPELTDYSRTIAVKLQEIRETPIRSKLFDIWIARTKISAHYLGDVIE